MNSALASRDRSAALVRALRTAGDPHDFKVPEFEDSLEIDRQGYAFKGWVRDGNEDRGLDEYDPWAAGVSPRVLAPAEPFVLGLELRPDLGERRWLDGKGRVQLRSQVWSDGVDDEDDRRNGGGRLLVATPACLDALMRSTDMDLIVEVSLTQKTVQGRYARERDAEIAGKITEIVLFRPGCPPWRVPFSPGPRPGARRRTRSRSIH